MTGYEGTRKRVLVSSWPFLVGTTVAIAALAAAYVVIHQNGGFQFYRDFSLVLPIGLLLWFAHLGWLAIFAGRYDALHPKARRWAAFWAGILASACSYASLVVAPPETVGSAFVGILVVAGVVTSSAVSYEVVRFRAELARSAHGEN